MPWNPAEATKYDLLSEVFRKQKNLCLVIEFQTINLDNLELLISILRGDSGKEITS